MKNIFIAAVLILTLATCSVTREQDIQMKEIRVTCLSSDTYYRDGEPSGYITVWEDYDKTRYELRSEQAFIKGMSRTIWVRR